MPKLKSPGIKQRLLILVSLQFIVSVALCQTSDDRNRNRTFDFWFGHWNAHSLATDNLLGENHIIPILDSAVMFENWTDVLGTEGKSFTLYDKARKSWRQTWTDNSGDMSETIGQVKGDTMTFLSLPHSNSAGKIVINRMRLIKKSKDELLQTGEVSFDNTTTWNPTFNFVYKRKTTAGLNGKDFSFEVYGIKILVPDIEKARSFYTEVLGFPVDNLLSKPGKLVLYSNSIKLILAEDKNVIEIKDKAYGSTSLALQVNNIDSTISYLKSKNVKFIKNEKRKEGVGYSFQILDPFGNKISMMQITVGEAKRVHEPRVYNCGLYVHDMKKARDFYLQRLGFEERSQQYLPDDMPLGYTDGKFAFMLHAKRKDMPSTEKTNMRLMFRSDNIYKAYVELKQISSNAILSNDVVNFTDNQGIACEVIAGFSEK